MLYCNISIGMILNCEMWYRDEDGKDYAWSAYNKDISNPVKYGSQLLELVSYCFGKVSYGNEIGISEQEVLKISSERLREKYLNGDLFNGYHSFQILLKE